MTRPTTASLSAYDPPPVTEADMIASSGAVFRPLIRSVFSDAPQRGNEYYLIHAVLTLWDENREMRRRIELLEASAARNHGKGRNETRA